MPLGLLLLFALAAVIFFGLAERVLDRMRLTDTQALIFIGLMIAGSFVDIPLARDVRLNVGGALVPLIIVGYLLVRADEARERVRAILAAIVTAVAVSLVGMLSPGGPHAGSTMLIDPLWLFGLTGGIVAYLAGRSRRSAFIAGVGGLVLVDLFQVVRGGTAHIGGAGVFDQIVVAGVLAVGLAELIGETRERLQGGPDQDPSRPLALHQDEGTSESPTEHHTEEERRDERPE